MSIFARSDTPIIPAAVVAKYGPLSGAIIDLNYEIGRFYYGGEYYDSVAAIIAAGFGDDAGGIERLDLPAALGSEYVLFAEGVAGPGGDNYLAALDDGADGSATDNLVAISQNPGEDALCYVLAASISQLETNFLSANAMVEGVAIRAALRIKTNNAAVSYNNGPIEKDITVNRPGGISRLILGDRDDGTRPWAGTVRRIAVLNAVVPDSDLPGVGA